MSRTRIKICGLTREADVDAAVEAGADAVGFVLWGGSARRVGSERAAQLAARLPPFVTPVLLFVNASAGEIAAATAELPQAALQFHGDETPTQCEAAGRPYLRAARMAEGFDLLDFARSWRAESTLMQALLLDAHAPGYGGAGKVFDWSRIPPNVPCPVVLSGGLSPANVTDGVLRVRPFAVDVSSGVEVGKGIKDAALMRRFCEAVREADARIEAGPVETR
ncbi:MAG: phosphoribosylanthranilate isomerase [Rubrivivax sp.]|nr:phosphoribosylanthranilate isomerase [Rubrivivax sp.]